MQAKGLWQGESERCWGLATKAGKRCGTVEPSTRRKCKWHILKGGCSATRSGSAYGLFLKRSTQCKWERKWGRKQLKQNDYTWLCSAAQFAAFGRARFRSAALRSAKNYKTPRPTQQLRVHQRRWRHLAHPYWLLSRASAAEHQAKEDLGDVSCLAQLYSLTPWLFELPWHPCSCLALPS